jgi:hypothetical protein
MTTVWRVTGARQGFGPAQDRGRRPRVSAGPVVAGDGTKPLKRFAMNCGMG